MEEGDEQGQSGEGQLDHQSGALNGSGRKLRAPKCQFESNHLPARFGDYELVEQHEAGEEGNQGPEDGLDEEQITQGKDQVGDQGARRSIEGDQGGRRPIGGDQG